MARQVSRDRLAVLAGLAAPLALAAILVPFHNGFPDTDAALALQLVVVGVAANGYRLAGLLAAASAAAWFDFFLTVPYERFTITRRADIQTTVLLLAVGVAVTEIAVWGRRQHGAASRRAGYLDGISTAARAVATGSSPAALTEQVCGQLTRLLSLSSCRFQAGAALSGGGRSPLGEPDQGARRTGHPPVNARLPAPRSCRSGNRCMREAAAVTGPGPVAGTVMAGRRVQVSVAVAAAVTLSGSPVVILPPVAVAAEPGNAMPVTFTCGLHFRHRSAGMAASTVFGWDVRRAGTRVRAAMRAA